MKNLITILLINFSFIGFCYSQSGNVHLEVSGGAYLGEIYQARLGLEFSKKYHNSFALNGDLIIFNNENDLEISENDFEFLIGPTYKHVLTRGKNTYLKFPIGGSIGTNIDNDFMGALNAGLEFGFVLYGNVVVHITQNNQIAFNSHKQWRSGLMAGIKIPFN